MGVKKDLEESFDFDIVDEFLDHYDFICETLEPIILGLEEKENYNNNINELFRIFHNLKSATGFLNLKIINNLAKFTEDVLEDARKLEGPATNEFIDWLLAISDQLNAWLKNFKNDHKEYTHLNGKIVDIPVDLEAK